MPQHRTHRKLRDAIIAQETFDITLAEELCEWCLRENRDIYEAFLSADRLPNTVLAHWTTPKAADYIATYTQDTIRRKPKIGAIFKDEDDLQKRDAILGLMEKYFITTPENGSSLYRIVDGTNMIVEDCCPNNLTQQVSQAIKHELWAFNKMPSKPMISAIVDAYQHNCMLEPAPKLWAQLEEPVWCLGRAMTQPDPKQPFDHIKALFDRMNDPEAVAAYLWGIYSGRNIGRQCLYLHEPMGEGGKSSFFRAFMRLFGDRITAALNWMVLNNSSHASEHFAGKKIVVIGDNKNPSILMSQAVKELSGDDKVMLNPKHQAIYSTYLEARLIVLANCLPNITSERHNQTRTLFITMSELTAPVDPHWSDHYASEMPGFLAWAEQCYNERCPDDYEIKVNDAVKEAVALRVAEYESRYSLLVDDNFVADPEGKVTLADLDRLIASHIKGNRDAMYAKEELLAWLTRNMGIARKRTNRGVVYYQGLRWKTGRDKRNSANDYQMDDEQEVA